MSVRRNAEIVMSWLGLDHSTTLAGIVETGLMTHREASDAVRFAVRHGAMELVPRPSSKATDRRLYQLTGRVLPEPRNAPSKPCFDRLLMAWGMCWIPAPRAAYSPRSQDQEN
jgi:hypothetical protein